MPIIRVDRDDEKLHKEDMIVLCNAIQKIVKEVTKIDDVFVYANSSQVKLYIAPIEIFIEMSKTKIENKSVLLDEITSKLSLWKSEHSFSHIINVTLIPMDWEIRIGI